VELPPAFNGAVLAPWPNRIRDGRWNHQGQRQQLAISEPARDTALHGLVAWQNWQLVSAAEQSVDLNCQVPAQPGLDTAFTGGERQRREFDPRAARPGRRHHRWADDRFGWWQVYTSDMFEVSDAGYRRSVRDRGDDLRAGCLQHRAGGDLVADRPWLARQLGSRGRGSAECHTPPRGHRLQP
jgi:hypothetical protein